jgi:hypothetical protein
MFNPNLNIPVPTTTGESTFNSLYGIQKAKEIVKQATEEILSIPFMGYLATTKLPMTSPTTIFQFPLWDTYSSSTSW